MIRARPGRADTRTPWWLYLLLACGLLLVVVPFAWMVLGAFKSNAEFLRTTPALLPDQWTLDNFRRLLSRGEFVRSLLNSVGIALVVTAANLLFCSMAGYALAKLRFAGSRPLLGLVLATLMVPTSVTLVPLFVFMSKVGLVNSYAAVTLPFFAGAFGVFLMRQFMLTVPDELIAAARMDGAAEWTIFTRVVLPLLKPALAALAVFQFLATWNSFLWPLIALTDEARYTLPVALATIAIGPDKSDYGLLMAGSVVLVAPVVALFVVLQRHFTWSIALTGPRAVPAAPRRRRAALTGWAFSAPFVLLFATFMLIPILASLALSFTGFAIADLRDWGGAPFVGLDNYARLWKDPEFRTALRNTAYFTVVGVPCTVVSGLVLALALDRGLGRLQTLFRAGFYLPVVTSIVAVAVTWRYLLDPEVGPLNAALAQIGIEGPDWLGEPATTMPAIIALGVWRNAGEAMVIFLAALQTIDRELLRAARVDGARAWHRLRYIKLPLLRPAILFATVVTSISYLHVFEEPFVLTGPNGGADQAGFTASMFVYQQGFRFFDLGYASAAAYTMFVFVAVLAIAQFKLLAPRP